MCVAYYTSVCVCVCACVRVCVRVYIDTLIFVCYTVCLFIILTCFCSDSLCKFMDSAKKPLWLVWNNEDTFAEDTKIYIMYKSGDGWYMWNM